MTIFIIKVVLSMIGAAFIMMNIEKIFGTKETREAEMEYQIWKRSQDDI